MQRYQKMHFRGVFLLLLAISCNADEQFTCQRTSTSSTVFQVTGGREIQQGPPGKRGAVGAVGPPGQKGDKGDPGVPDNSEPQRVRGKIAFSVTNITAALKSGFINLEDGWVAPFSGYQYKLLSSQQNWEESRRLCQAWDGDLAAVGMQDMGIRIIIKKALNLGDSRVWIGLSDIETEGTWKWVDGSISTVATSIWDKNQPNGGNDHDCAYMFPDDGNPSSPTSYDWACGENYRALCEKEIE